MRRMGLRQRLRDAWPLARLRRVEQRLAAQEAEAARLGPRLAVLAADVESLGRSAEALARALAALAGERVPQLETQTASLVAEWTAATSRTLPRLESRIDDLARHVVPLWNERVPQVEGQVARLVEELQAHVARDARRAEVLAQIAATSLLARAASVPDTLVSVILPTRDRAALLPAALDSVRAQTHERWELLVVDDGSVDATPELLAGLDDPRIRVVSGAGAGPAAARNLGLAAARGAIVAYLDDDNVMAAEWLRGVVWALHTHPGVDVVYGALLAEQRGGDGGAFGRPLHVWFEPWDRERLEAGNITDLGALAHRAGLPEAHFTDDVEGYEDWDLLLRLTRTRPPLALPLLAGVYRVPPVSHVSDRPGARAAFERVRARHAAAAARS